MTVNECLMMRDGLGKFFFIVVRFFCGNFDDLKVTKLNREILSKKRFVFKASLKGLQSLFSRFKRVCRFEIVSKMP